MTIPSKLVAIRLMNSLSSDSPGFLSLIVIAELVWVLAISYHYRRKQIGQVVENLLQSKELIIERAELSRGRCLISKHAAPTSPTV